jgi:putative FmdB family regulatory protein
MPIYEFKCLDCAEVFELLVMGDDDTVEMRCPKCESESFDRVLSRTTHFMGTGVGGGGGSVSTQTRSCPAGSCTTYTVPGHSR